jgi:SAM-dependent methyltransferase
MAEPSNRADYGFDAPYVPMIFSLLAVAFLGAGQIAVAAGHPGTALFRWGLGAFFAMSAATFVYATRRGKFRVWDELLDGLSLRGDERGLDVGCGRGAVLIALARRLPRGKVTGVDLWRAEDQSGNDVEATRRNCTLEGVSERVELCTADMRALPLADASVSLVVSSLAIHNVPDADGRQKAIDELWRVLAPGGRAVLVDMRHASAYAERLRTLGAAEVTSRSAGWRMWFGGPQARSIVVTARKPG